jgi:hypothetical protein
MNFPDFYSACAALFSIATISCGGTTSIGINFVGARGQIDGVTFSVGGRNDQVKTQPLAPDEEAGVVPQKNWNNIDVPSQYVGNFSLAQENLTDNNGTVTPAKIEYQGAGLFWVKIEDNGGDFRLMRGYLDIYETPKRQVVSNLPEPFASHPYDVIVYIQGWSEGCHTWGKYTIGEKSILFDDFVFGGEHGEWNTDFNGTWDSSSTSGYGNYTVFPNVSGSSFTLEAVGDHSTHPTLGGEHDRRAPINAIQIVCRTEGGEVGTVMSTGWPVTVVAPDIMRLRGGKLDAALLGVQPGMCLRLVGADGACLFTGKIPAGGQIALPPHASGFLVGVTNARIGVSIRAIVAR